MSTVKSYLIKSQDYFNFCPPLIICCVCDRQHCGKKLLKTVLHDKVRVELELSFTTDQRWTDGHNYVYDITE